MDIEIFYRIIAFIAGAIVGSFLNVCIVRWPHEKSVVRPPSHCPECKQPIRWYDNIPLLSYFILQGKCRYCGKKFSFRYVFIEFLTAGIFLAFFMTFGLNWLLVPYLFMISCFIIATFVDLEHRIIPDEVSVGGMVAGFLFSVLFPGLHQGIVREELWIVGWGASAVIVVALATHFLNLRLQKAKVEEGEIYFVFICAGLVAAQLAALLVPETWGVFYPVSLALAASIQGAIIGGGLIYCMGVVGEIIFRKEAMGGGDVKLMAMIGAFLGWKMAVLTFFIAPFFGAVVGIVEKIRTKDSAIAYGPYLVLGAVISMFWGRTIIQWLVNGYHL